MSPPVPPPRPPRPALGAGVGSSAPGGPKESTSQLQQTTKPPVYSQSTDTVGDHRISYIVTPAQTISVIAQVYYLLISCIWPYGVSFCLPDYLTTIDYS